MLTCEQVILRRGEFELRADFSIESTRKTAIIGPSGGGKSTLLAAVGGFLVLDGGRITWDGQNLAGLAPGKRPISTIFQDNNLFPHLTVAQNVGMGLRADLRLNSSQKTQVDHALARVGLAEMKDRKPAALSGGQIARVALARMLLQACPLVLLDEPFAALGPALKADMLDLVSTLIDEIRATLLMVSHDPEDAKRIADQVVLVADGTAQAPQETAEIFADPPAALRAYLGQ